MLRIGGHPVLAPHDRTDSSFFDTPGHTVFANWKTHVVKFIRYFRATVPGGGLAECTTGCYPLESTPSHIPDTSSR